MSTRQSESGNLQAIPAVRGLVPWRPIVAADPQSEDLVRRLMRARETKQAVSLPDDFALRFAAQQGYALQALHAEAMLARYGGDVVGVRLSGGEMAALAAMGLTGPMRGPIFSAFAHESPAALRRGDYILCAVEAGIAVRIGEDIGGHPYLPGRDVLVDAIEAVIPVIEVVDSRLRDPERRPAAAVLADLCYSGAWIHGKAVTDWKDLDLPGLQVCLLSSGAQVRNGSGSRVMGDPLHAVSLLVADLGRDGRKLSAGEVVSTGTCTLPYLARAGESLVADFGALGQVSLMLA